MIKSISQVCIDRCSREARTARRCLTSDIIRSNLYYRISCIVWEKEQCKKVELSVPDLGGLIERQVAALDHEPAEVFYTGVLFTLLIGSFPFLFRLYSSPSLQQLIVVLITQRALPDHALLSKAFITLCGASWQVHSLRVYIPYHLGTHCIQHVTSSVTISTSQSVSFVP